MGNPIVYLRYHSLDMEEKQVNISPIMQQTIVKLQSSS